MTLGEQLRLTMLLAVPAIMAQFSSILMQYIDTAMVGHLGAGPSASVGLMATSTWIFGGFTMAVASGFSVQVAHLCGASDFFGARKVVRQGLVCILALSLLFGLLGVGISPWLPFWLGTDGYIARGATDYFLHGRTRPMANWSTPKSTGEYIGQLLEARGNTLRVRLNEGIVLHNGDGLTIGAEGFSVNGVEGNIVKINKAISFQPSAFRPLYRNNDIEFTKNLKSERKIPIDIVFRETENGFELSYQSAFSHQQSAFSYPHEPAKNETKALDTIRTQLTKLGDTPYVAREIRIETKPYFIPISILNEWRRTILQAKPVLQRSGLTAKAVLQRSEQAKPVVSGHLMECKYCILHESGHCRKTNPYPKDKEPRYLRLRTGKVLALHFNCAKCEMTVDEA